MVYNRVPCRLTGGEKKSEDDLPAEYLASSLAKQPQVR